MPNAYIQSVIDQFRGSGGADGMILLTTTGARSGQPRTVPLGAIPDGDDRLLIVASAAGAERNPAWFHNLVAQPEVTVETGKSQYPARATVLAGDERDAAFARVLVTAPGYGDYQKQTTRTIPVVLLTPLP